MYNKGDRVRCTSKNIEGVPISGAGTVIQAYDKYIWVHFDDYDEYGTDDDIEPDEEEYVNPEDDYHWVRPSDIEPYHQEVPYDPEQMLVEEDDL